LDADPRRQVIPRPFIDDILTNFDPHAITEDSFPGPRFGQPPNSAYRSLHNIYRYPGENVISASGNFGQFCEVFPNRKIVIVKLSTYDFEQLEELFALSDKDRAAFCAIADALAGKAG
jgi:CubicO group peptidase (beta-lactamase class C family)